MLDSQIKLGGNRLFAVAVLVLVCAQTWPKSDAATNQTGAKLKLGVYIESLCPDSKRFFVNQLVPTFKELSEFLDLKVVPFGHARTLGNNKLVCQHGARECEGNRRMACVQTRAANDTQMVNTIGCLFEPAGLLKPAECVSRHMAQVEFADIDKCTSSDESYKLMVANEKETGRVGYIPHLTLGGNHSEILQSELEFDLKSTICKHLGGSAPALCTEQTTPQD